MCTPDELAKSLNRLASDVKLIIELARKRRLKYSVSRLDRLHSKIRTSAKEVSNNKNLTVCVIGNYSSGKSSFINKLIGENICPVGDIPITQSLTRFSQPSSEQNRIQVFKIVKRRKVKISLKEYQRECTKENAEYVFHCLLPAFPFEGIDLYDTPGFESVGNETGDNSTLSVAENCDMVLFILDINVGSPDGTVLKKISELNDKGKKCILVLNKADTMFPQNVNALVEKCGKKHKPQFRAIHAFSSHYAEKHCDSDKKFYRQKNQDLLTEITEFVNFRNEILRSKFTKKTDDIVAEVKKKLTEFRKDCVQRYGDESQCSIAIRRNEIRKKKLENAKSRLRNDRESIVEKIEEKAYYYSRVEPLKKSSESCWNFDSESFESRVYIYLHKYFAKVLRGIVPKSDLELRAKDLAIDLSNHIRKRLNKRHRFTEDEEEDKFDNLKIGKDISQIVFRSKVFPLLSKEKLECKKQTAKIAEDEKLFSLIKKTKTNAKRLGSVPKRKKETAF